MNYVELIQHKSEQVFGNKTKANVWLTRPNVALGGQSPIELARNESGYLVVKDVLERIDHGYAG